MNDPHVVALFYNIQHGPSVDYREAEPRDYEAENFSVRVEDKKVCFTMKAHYATEEEAREAVREYISRWEFTVGLRRGPDKFKLVYQARGLWIASRLQRLTALCGILRHFGGDRGWAVRNLPY